MMWLGRTWPAPWSAAIGKCGSTCSFDGMLMPRRRRIPMLLIPLILVLGACDGDGLSGLRPGESTVPGDGPTETAPPDENPDPTAPPATDAPETAPPGTNAPETAPPEPEDPDDDEGRNWGPILAIVIGIAALLAIVSALSKRRKPAAPPRPDPRRQLVSTARWIHDQLSLELLALPAADSQQRWNAERGRLDQLSIDLRVQAAERDPEVWTNLSNAVSALAASLDTAVRLRATADVDDQLVREAVAIANRQRAELQTRLVIAEQSI